MSTAANVLLLLGGLVVLPGLAHAAGAVEEQATPPPAGEVLRYDWDLGGFFGNLASLFIPGKGAGTLSTCPSDDGALDTQLHITSPRSHKGEFWLYGARIDPRTPRTVRVWSSYLFRGKSREKSADLEEAEVVDVASGIYLLRRDPPQEPRRLRIWSEGKIYPVLVRPAGSSRRRLAGVEVTVREYRIRGVEEPGARLWEGKLDLFLADDAAATPVEIVLARHLVRVRLTLVGGGPATAQDCQERVTGGS